MCVQISGYSIYSDFSKPLLWATRWPHVRNPDQARIPDVCLSYGLRPIWTYFEESSATLKIAPSQLMVRHKLHYRNGLKSRKLDFQKFKEIWKSTISKFQKIEETNSQEYSAFGTKKEGGQPTQVLRNSVVSMRSYGAGNPIFENQKTLKCKNIILM